MRRTYIEYTSILPAVWPRARHICMTRSKSRACSAALNTLVSASTCCAYRSDAIACAKLTSPGNKPTTLTHPTLRQLYIRGGMLHTTFPATLESLAVKRHPDV